MFANGTHEKDTKHRGYEHGLCLKNIRGPVRLLSFLSPSFLFCDFVFIARRKSNGSTTSVVAGRILFILERQMKAVLSQRIVAFSPESVADNLCRQGN